MARLSPLVIPEKAFTCPMLCVSYPLTPVASGELLGSPASVATLGCLRAPEPMWIDEVGEKAESVVSEEAVEASVAEGSTEDSCVAEDTTEPETCSRRRRRGRRGGEWQAPALPNTSACRPCDHNSWDNVRVKKDKTTLRCRVCQLQWKVDHAALLDGGVKCEEFTATNKCSKGTACTHIHIHRFKQNLIKRKAIFGQELLLPQMMPDDRACHECDDVCSLAPLSSDSSAPATTPAAFPSLPTPSAERPALTIVVGDSECAYPLATPSAWTPGHSTPTGEQFMGGFPERRQTSTTSVSSMGYQGFPTPAPYPAPQSGGGYGPLLRVAMGYGQQGCYETYPQVPMPQGWLPESAWKSA